MTPPHERELPLNPRAAITGASSVAFVTADAISHADTASSPDHRPATAAAAAATATSASASGDPAGSSGTGSALTAAATRVFARMPYWLSLLADLSARDNQPGAARATLDAAALSHELTAPLIAPSP